MSTGATKPSQPRSRPPGARSRADHGTDTGFDLEQAPRGRGEAKAEYDPGTVSRCKGNIRSKGAGRLVDIGSRLII